MPSDFIQFAESGIRIADGPGLANVSRHFTSHYVDDVGSLLIAIKGVMCNTWCSLKQTRENKTGGSPSVVTVS